MKYHFYFLFYELLRTLFGYISAAKCIDSLIRKRKYLIRTDICDFRNHSIFISICSYNMIYFFFSDCTEIIKCHSTLCTAIMNIQTGHNHFFSIIRKCNIHRCSAFFYMNGSFCQLFSALAVKGQITGSVFFHQDSNTSVRRHIHLHHWHGHFEFSLCTTCIHYIDLFSRCIGKRHILSTDSHNWILHLVTLIPDDLIVHCHIGYTVIAVFQQISIKIYKLCRLGIGTICCTGNSIVII